MTGDVQYLKSGYRTRIDTGVRLTIECGFQDSGVTTLLDLATAYFEILARGASGKVRRKAWAYVLCWFFRMACTVMTPT